MLTRRSFCTRLAGAFAAALASPALLESSPVAPAMPAFRSVDLLKFHPGAFAMAMAPLVRRDVIYGMATLAPRPHVQSFVEDAYREANEC